MVNKKTLLPRKIGKQKKKKRNFCDNKDLHVGITCRIAKMI